jgi:predicted CXXCH cytochrome family protein
MRFARPTSNRPRAPPTIRLSMKERSAGSNEKERGSVPIQLGAASVLATRSLNQPSDVLVNEQVRKGAFMKTDYRLAILILSLTLGIGSASAQDYQGAGTTFPGCGTNGCHNVAGRDQYSAWLVTGHGLAYDSVAFIQQNAECLPCHTTGWDSLLANGGFDDYFPPVTPEDSAGIQRMKNVQCEACHGPTEFTVNHPPESDPVAAAVCGRCHTDDHHPTFGDWEISLHAVSKNTSLPGFGWISGDRQCAACHTAEGFIQFIADTGYVPDVDPPGDAGHDLTCAGCHEPHDNTIDGQLRMPVVELCSKCHNPEYDPSGPVPIGEEVHHATAFMFEGIGGYEFPGYTYTSSLHTMVLTDKCVTCHVWTRPYATGIPAYTGHTFDPRGEACLPCHTDFDTTAHSFDYRGVQTEIESLLTVLGEELAAASSDDSLTDVFNQAKFNRDFVESEGSLGIHNTDYARALLESAINEFTPTVGVDAVSDGIPREFSLAQNYPNPFNPVTVISFSVPKKEFVRIDVFDILGRHVRTLVNEEADAGIYRIRWDGVDQHGTQVISGVYFYKLTSQSFESVRKMILLK